MPDRDVELGFAATEYSTVPLPFPEFPEVTVSHAWSLDADHAQPAVATTPTVPLDAPEPAAADMAGSEYEHAKGSSKLKTCPLPLNAIVTFWAYPAQGC